MSDHIKEVPPAAVLLGREVVSVDAKSGEVQLRFLADRQFANRHGTVQGGMLAAMFLPGLLYQTWPAAVSPDSWWMMLPLPVPAVAMYFVTLKAAGPIFVARREKLLATIEGRN